MAQAWLPVVVAGVVVMRGAGSHAPVKSVPFQQVALAPLLSWSSYSSRWTPDPTVPESAAVPHASAVPEHPAPHVLEVMAALCTGELMTGGAGMELSMTTFMMAAGPMLPAASVARAETRWVPGARTSAVAPPTANEP